ncbi:MAG TPA: PAS domain S-box protein, partial [Allocoleopsis sp.]
MIAALQTARGSLVTTDEPLTDAIALFTGKLQSKQLFKLNPAIGRLTMGQAQSPSLKENILIVDDNPTNLNLLKEILSGAGYKVRAALSAQVALKSADLTLPDLILLDILMPEMDGYQACEQLKASPATRDIPIIFISALSEVMDKVKAFSLGGVDYITKPFQAEEVLARVENQLRLQRLSKQLLEQNQQLEQELRERQRAEQALRENQSLLTGIIEGTTDQVAALDRNFRYIAFNSSYQAEFLKLFGREIAIGTSLIEALAHLPDSQAKWLEMWERALAGEQFTLIQEFGNSNRDRNYYEITYSSIKDKSGQLLGASHIIKNVSDRIRSEQALRDSERRLMFALSGAKAGSWELNLATQQAIWSDENFKLMGYEPEYGEVHYDNWLQRIHPEDRERVKRQVQQTIAEKSELALEYRVLLSDRTIRWLKAIGKFIDNEPGNPSTIAGIQLDITERKQLEHELAHQKELLDAFFRSAHVGMCAVDTRMSYFLVNEALAEAHGISVADHIGKTPWDIVPDLAPKQEAVFRYVLETGQPVPQFELSGETKKLPGVTRTWLNSYFPIHNPNNQPMGIGVVVVEITHRKVVEAALRESEERFRNAFDYAAIGMTLVALDGRFLKVNSALCEIMGYSEEELLATTFQAITYPDDVETNLAKISQVLTGEIRFYQMEKRYFHKQGRIVWTLLSGSLVRDEQGQPLYFIGQIQDISDRKQAE